MLRRAIYSFKIVLTFIVNNLFTGYLSIVIILSNHSRGRLTGKVTTFLVARAARLEPATNAFGMRYSTS